VPAGHQPDFSPAARQVAETALRTAERGAQRHALAAAAGDELGRRFAPLFVRPEAARAEFVAMTTGGVGAEIAADRLARHPATFGALTAAARGDGGREPVRSATGAARQWVQAEAQRPAQPSAQVTAEFTRAQTLVQPFRELDRAKELAERALELARGHERGGRGGR